jgi:hypothetical protein
MRNLSTILRKTLTATAIAATLASPAVFAETTIGGYGELHYNNLDKNGTDSASIDFHRFVLMFGHDFNDKIRFFSEFELEHAFVGDTDTDTDGTSTNIEKAPGEVELEQAYIEIDLDSNRSVISGVFLIPVGLMNETHEPPTFYGVERNPVEKNIIPATWWEAGVMYSAHTDSGLSYNLAIHSGLNSATGSVRSGRQKVAKANADSLAYTGRIKYTGMPGLEVASTLQYQEDMSQGTAADAVSATMIELHAKYATGPFGVTALYATWDVNITTGAQTQNGSILETSYKVSDKLGIFARQNNWSNDDGATDKAQTDIGFNYWPHEDVVFKFDLQSQNDDAGNADGFNLGLGYQF